MVKRKASGTAWCVDWDSGGPGDWGRETVYLSRGKYTYEDSSTGQRYRPRKKLEDLLTAASLTWVNEATMSISSDLLSAEEIVALLHVDLPAGRTVGINDEEWICVAPGVLEREVSEDADQPTWGKEMSAMPGNRLKDGRKAPTKQPARSKVAKQVRLGRALRAGRKKR